MADLPRPPEEVMSVGGDPVVTPDGNAQVVSSTLTPSEGERTEVLQVLEETLTVSTRRRVTGGVRVGTRTEVVEEPVEAELDRYRVEVTRVPVGRVVDKAPSARAVGDTTIIPVVEERLVMVKQLFLVEEVHVRHVVERELVREPGTLRRQRAVSERLDGRRDDPTSPRSSIDPGHDDP